MRGSDFSYEKGGVGKIGGCFKKGCITYFHTSQPFPVLSFSECLMCVCLCVCVCVCVCVLFLDTIFIRTICVSQEEASLTSSN